MSRKEKRREEAEKRNTRWRAMTPEKQLEELDKRLGKGKGAKKQRSKLLKKLKEAKNAQ